MKKILLIAVIAGAGTLTSCKKETKDYMCSCTYTKLLWKPATAHHEIKDATEEDAKRGCHQYEDGYASINGSATCWLE